MAWLVDLHSFEETRGGQEQGTEANGAKDSCPFCVLCVG